MPADGRSENGITALSNGQSRANGKAPSKVHSTNSKNEEIEQKVGAYYDSQDAAIFYGKLWGGESLHIGVYPGHSVGQLCDVETVRTASRTADELLTHEALETLHKLHPVTSLQEKGKKIYRVADMGAGLGAFGRKLCHRSKSVSVDCFELSSRQNEVNKERNTAAGLEDRIRVFEKSYTDVGEVKEEDKYHLVVSQDAFLHCVEKEAIVSEIARITREGAFVVFTDIMQTVGVRLDEMEGIYSRLHLKEMGSAAQYIHLFGLHGFELLSFRSMPEHVGTHYASVRHLLASEGPSLGVSDGFVGSVCDSLDMWTDAVRSGNITWGRFVFRKKNLEE
uniref:Methyltransferase domain-containing protein n=1 Tax=Chromera velia CCMP2878 TaxID=1169474 RepID=A0A0G4G8X5_9ALVE|eukprot:Cvel_20796.t1-p1 / transcript=Cvel_20796.t1 / gene=Cvel_20796 / organism=Chromera_velia_CCMP2878 / gene_product=Sarcosine/dimethylglycine N-methyltransferase, putative / transcript_product=Sarcosine/dimethylglycine N-methyltransferase, putative / location=Cvel_scaffold1899:19373-21135(-) / protein_length=335 / sequence_SO=supercontig / SO=protein_coding / is_pseudo=false